MPQASMPLASGYLKSTALSDPHLASEFDFVIHNFRGSDPLGKMARDLFHSAHIPDILACSVQGWNFRTFGVLAETFKQLNPRGWVIFGGNHVAHQAARVFATHPAVDIVVDGEGELIFHDLLHARLDGRSSTELEDVQGISFRTASGAVHSTPERPRIEDLDQIPSPFLTGAIPLSDEEGRFPYDVALLETNRGCPYKCSFCYWGGAVGQRVRSFSRERLRQELELFGRHQVDTVVLCDANFGMLRADAEFVDDLLEVRERYGYPKALETSWAKNKSKVFYEIVQKMARTGLRSSFTLALQTLNDDALATMRRRNMKVNDWEDLAAWLYQAGLDCYAEIIWGAPGETVRSFLEGYDRLAQHVSRIAAYPLLLLPNTDYSAKKEEYGFVTVRGDQDDFEYVLASNSYTLEDNRRMQRFLFWARALSENMVLRHIWKPLRELGGITQSRLLSDIADWFDACPEPAARQMSERAAFGAVDPDALSPALTWLFGSPDAERLLRQWWSDSIRPHLPGETRPVLDEIFRYDLLTRPLYPEPAESDPDAPPVVEIDGEKYYQRTDNPFGCDVPQVLTAIRRGEPYAPYLGATTLTICYKVGFDEFAASTNHEETAHFMGVDVRRLGAAHGSMSVPGGRVPLPLAPRPTPSHETQKAAS